MLMESTSLRNFVSTLTVKSRKIRHPQTVVFELSYGCNLHCVHCLNPTHRALPEELTTEEICGLITQIADYGVWEVTFTGGEIFTRPDRWTLLKHAHEAGLLINVLTNATRLDPDAVQQLEALKARVHVTIYGASPKVYESVTGIPGSFQKFQEGIELLAAREIPLAIHMPVMTLNRHELVQARDFAKSKGAQFKYSFDIHPRQDGNLEPLQYRLTPEEKIQAIQDLGDGLFETCQPRGKPVGSDRFIDCDCGQSKFAVTPYGEMNLCTAFPYPKYDLKKGSLSEGWEILKKTVDQARPNANYHCTSCHLRSFCRQGRSDAWLETGDMSVCLPHFKSTAHLEKELYEYRVKSEE